MKWLEFREKIFEMDGCMCVECGRTDKQVILQVHHKQYLKGKLPWEYPPSLCETLCQGCHARHHGKIRPDHGWDLLFENDLGDLSGECDLCGTSLRYQFHIHHPYWEPMIVGTVCCDNLTGTTEATDFRKRTDRKKRFLKSPKWKTTKRGLVYEKKGLTLRIMRTGNGFRIQVNDVLGKMFFEDASDAKDLIFDLIENGKIERFSR